MMSTMLPALAAYPYGPGGGGFWWPVVPLVWGLFWLAALVAVVFGVRRRWRGKARSAGESVLAERFALGEIDEREYRERLSVLRERR